MQGGAGASSRSKLARLADPLPAAVLALIIHLKYSLVAFGYLPGRELLPLQKAELSKAGFNHGNFSAYQINARRDVREQRTRAVSAAMLFFGPSVIGGRNIGDQAACKNVMANCKRITWQA